MKTKEIKPCTTNLCEVCKQIYDKKEDGVNSLQTLNPYGTHKRHCAKLSEVEMQSQRQEGNMVHDNGTINEKSLIENTIDLRNCSTEEFNNYYRNKPFNKYEFIPFSLGRISTI